MLGGLLTSSSAHPGGWGPPRMASGVRQGSAPCPGRALGVPSAAPQTLRAQSVPYRIPLLRVLLLRKSRASGTGVWWTPETCPKRSLLLTASGPTPV